MELILLISFILVNFIWQINEVFAETVTIKTINDNITYPHNPFLVTFSGRVLSKSGKPINQALVEIYDTITKTDVNGFFRIVIKIKDKKRSYRFIVNIKKEGYGLLSKVYNSGIQNGVWILTEATKSTIDPTRNNLIRDNRRANSCSGSLSSKVNWLNYGHRQNPRHVNSQGTYLGEASSEIKAAVKFAENANTCNNGISLSIPANGLEDSLGNTPKDKISVSLSTVDIYDKDSMPGDYTAIQEDSSGYMVTYGAGTMLTFSGDKIYNLKKEYKAILSITINSNQLKNTKKLPKEIQLLQYDEKQGIWKVIGRAKLNKNQDAYVGEINHFSAFNMDLIKTDQACIRINSAAISEDYDLEITIPYGGDVIIKTVSVDNTPEKLHVIYNLPSNTDIAIRAFRTEDNQIVPIMDTIMINTGQPQNPNEPNCPVYPYTACNSEVTISEIPLAPMLNGPSTSNGIFALIWDYTWPSIGSSQDGYELEESSTSPISGFLKIYTTVGTGDNRTHVQYNLNKSTGDYWYRVRAKNNTRYTAYSNIIHTSVQNPCTTSLTPTTLRIINDLYSSTDEYQIDWNKLNGIIRVRIGSTCDSVINSTAGEQLYLGETTTDILNTKRIAPNYLQESNYQDFNVSNINLASDGSYCVFIQNGWWDTILDPYSYDLLFYEKRNSMVLNCSNACCIEKWATIKIVRPYCNPEVIRASDYLPLKNWNGHCSCTNSCQ
jgi:hypothetical protein